MDKKTIDLIKERDKLKSQLSEKDDQLAAMRYKLKRMESERDEFLHGSKVFSYKLFNHLQVDINDN